MKATPLLKEILDAEEKTIVLQGGTWSGKTYQALIAICIWSIKHPGLITTVVAEDVPALKQGAIRDLKRIIQGNIYFEPWVYNYHETDKVLTFKNKSIIEFKSYLDEDDAKHGKRHILFMNEANNNIYEIFWQLAIRTNLEPFNKIILDYNPSEAFWCHDKVIGKKDTKLLITDHRHNTTLTKAQHNEIESISDPERWKVYARGMTGKTRSSIYNWHNTPVNEWSKEYDQVIWGIDYGYGSKETAGKTAIIKIIKEAKDVLRIREVCYHTGALDPRQIKDVMEAYGWENGQPFYSEVDPEQIAGLRRLGMSVRVAMKGPRSEWYGINKVKKFKVIYTAEDANLHYEYTHYKFVTVGEIVTQVVEKTNDFHLMAAIRYAVYTHFFRDV